MSKPRLFDSELGKIIFHVIHENNSAMGLIRNNVDFLKKAKEFGDLTDDKFFDVLQRIDNQVQKSNEAIDFLFVETDKNQSQMKGAIEDVLEVINSMGVPNNK